MSSRTRSAPLFYHSDWSPSTTSQETEKLTLSGDEAKHAMNARRLREGDAIEISNGQGAHGIGVVETAATKPPRLTLNIEKITLEPHPAIELVLATALPKGDRQSTLLDMATQVGMQRFVPLECDLSSVRFQPKMISRWRRILLSGCKQSRRVHLPDIDRHSNIEQLLTSIDDFSVVLFGDQNGEAVLDTAVNEIQDLQHIIVAVGPEAGFSDKELQLLKNHPKAFAITAGPHILRTETAAIVLLSLANQIAKL